MDLDLDLDLDSNDNSISSNAPNSDMSRNDVSDPLSKVKRKQRYPIAVVAGKRNEEGTGDGEFMTDFVDR